MQFINIVVHSVENMNFRVFLQYEFTHLGLDLYLEVSPALSPGLNCLLGVWLSGWQHGCWGQAGLRFKSWLSLPSQCDLGEVSSL